MQWRYLVRGVELLTLRLAREKLRRRDALERGLHRSRLKIILDVSLIGEVVAKIECPQKDKCRKLIEGADSTAN